MPHPDNILNKLKDHPVSPPAEMLDAIQKEIAEHKTEVLANAPLKNISDLRDNAVQPPSYLLDNIVAARMPTAPVKIIPLRKYLTAIAAGLLIIGGITIAIKWGNKKEDGKIDIAISAVKNHSLPLGDISKDTAITIPETLEDVIKNTTIQNSIKKYGHRLQQHTTASVDGDDFNLVNNDLFYSFTNFPYNNLPAFITGENPEAVRVRVDRSTSITLSEGMVAMMKKMYQQKRNGKPTWKARREKRKLQRWKNADEKFFDKHVEKNPMDPFDLAEFIF